MNLSGEAVGRARRALGLDPQQFIVVYDDLDLAVGRVRVRAHGSAGGHHGVESIIEALGSKEFPRVRIGIGRPASQSGNVDFLLDAMTTEEAETLAEAVARGADAVESMLAEGVPTAMNRFNGQPKGDRRSQAIDRR